jgi:ethanolamine utilization cobalamin adenosyltransferase
MKFITEDDLRILFRREPFTSYNTPEGSRLTPGARQFLMDKKVSIRDEQMAVKQKYNKLPEIKEAPKEEAPKKEVAKKEIYKDIFQLKKKTLQAQFLETGLELLNRDVLLAEQIFDLERKFSDLGKEGREENIAFKPCTGFHEENIHEYFEDCFEITGFHAQSEKGKEIILLHRLRCNLRELAAEAENENLNPVINRLSQMICLEYGGKLCQRKK